MKVEIIFTLCLVFILASCVSQRSASSGFTLDEPLANIGKANSVYVEFKGKKVRSSDTNIVSRWVSLLNEFHAGWTQHESPLGTGRMDVRILFSMNSMGLTPFWIHGTTLQTVWGTGSCPVYFRRELTSDELKRLKEQFERTEQPLSPPVDNTKSAP